MKYFIAWLLPLIVLSVGTTVHVYGTFAQKEDIVKLEEESSNTKSLICMLAIEVVKDKNKVKELCRGK